MTNKKAIVALVLAAGLGGAVATGLGVAVAEARDADDMAGLMGGFMPDGPDGGALFDFAAVDADKDGKITPAEMQAHRAAGLAAVDADKDGTLSAAELQAMIETRMQARAGDMAARMMAGMDSDSDGRLTLAELAAPPAPLGLLARIDTDGDGAVTEAEIAAARARMEARMQDGPRGGGHHGRGHGWFLGGDN